MLDKHKASLLRFDVRGEISEFIFSSNLDRMYKWLRKS